MSWLVSAGEWRDWTLAAQPEVRGPRVLELGFGPGHLLAALAASGLMAVGLDRSPQMVQKGASRVKGLGAHIVRGSGTHLPFKSTIFDTVTLTFPAPYVGDAAPEIARVLRPHGRVVVIDGGQPGPLALGVRLLQWASGGQQELRLPYQLALEQAGFVVTVERVPVQRSWVLRLVGQRSTGPELAT